MSELSSAKRRKLCSMGTGEIILVEHYKSLPAKIDEFERTVQSLAHSLYHFQAGITDVKVCHPCCGEVCFIITFLTKEDMENFQNGPERDARRALEGLVVNAEPSFQTSGCLMPAAPSLKCLLDYLKKNVHGTNHTEHDVRAVQKTLEKWYPRRCEYDKYIHWDPSDPLKYTRNLVFRNEHMDVILMCWPPGARSSIHDHDSSSCWVVAVEGQVHEVQYAVPCFDRQFVARELRSPTGATGRAGRLRQIGAAALEPGVCSSSYANNEIGLHRVENRSARAPAYTLHVYAPPLKHMKIFAETGEVRVQVMAAVPFQSVGGEVGEGAGEPEDAAAGVLDAAAWNLDQCRASRQASRQASPAGSRKNSLAAGAAGVAAAAAGNSAVAEMEGCAVAGGAGKVGGQGGTVAREQQGCAGMGEKAPIGLAEDRSIKPVENRSVRITNKGPEEKNGTTERGQAETGKLSLVKAAFLQLPASIVGL